MKTTEASAEDLDRLADELTAKQKLLDLQDVLLGKRIVRDADPKTIKEAKQLAANWIGTAAQESRNAEYLGQERDKLQRELDAEKKAHDETRAYRQRAEEKLSELRAELTAILAAIDDAMRDVDPEISWQSAGTRERLAALAEGRAP
jgi:hypothetical protein